MQTIVVDIPRSGRRVLITRHLDMQMEIWAAFNRDMDAFELFESETYPDPIGIGPAETASHARELARMYLREMETEASPY